MSQSPRESTGIDRLIDDPPPPAAGHDPLAGERDAMPGVNAGKAGANPAMQKAVSIVVCGIALVLGLVYYLPKLNGAHNAAAALPKNDSGVQLKKQSDSSFTDLPPMKPTEVKAKLDAENARKAADAERRAQGANPIVPAIPLYDLNAPPPPGVVSSFAPPPPGGARQITAEQAAAEKKRKDAEDARLKRLHSPLIAFGGKAEIASSGADRAGGTDSTGGRTTPGRGTTATVDPNELVKTLVEAQRAGAGGAGGGSLAGALANARGQGDAEPPGELARKLTPTKVTMVSAASLTNRDLLLTQGTFIDCTLETSLDSTVAGFTRCVTTRNVYSNSGRVILLERGSKIIGQYQGGIKQGQARIFVLWTRVETPHGVVIQLDSPGTDALGGAGLPGEVDTKFWARFGGASATNTPWQSPHRTCWPSISSGSARTVSHVGQWTDNMGRAPTRRGSVCATVLNPRGRPFKVG